MHLQETRLRLFPWSNTEEQYLSFKSTFSISWKNIFLIQFVSVDIFFASELKQLEEFRLHEQAGFKKRYFYFYQRCFCFVGMIVFEKRGKLLRIHVCRGPFCWLIRWQGFPDRYWLYTHSFHACPIVLCQGVPASHFIHSFFPCMSHRLMSRCTCESFYTLIFSMHVPLSYVKVYLRVMYLRLSAGESEISLSLLLSLSLSPLLFISVCVYLSLPFFLPPSLSFSRK